MSEAGTGERAAASGSPGVKAGRRRGPAPVGSSSQLTQGQADEPLLGSREGKGRKERAVDRSDSREGRKGSGAALGQISSDQRHAGLKAQSIFPDALGKGGQWLLLHTRLGWGGKTKDDMEKNQCRCLQREEKQISW